MPNYESKGGNWKKVSVKPVEITIEGKELDINKDGVVDSKDASLASKVLSNVKKIKKDKKVKVSKKVK